MTQFRPMLASTAQLSDLKYPLYASSKLDGVRALWKDGILLSRSLKPIPNRRLQSALWHINEQESIEGFDGELIVGSPTDKAVYRTTVSQAMTINDGIYDIRWYVFDHFDQPELHFDLRWQRLFNRDIIRILDQVLIEREDDLLQLEEKVLAEGYEGLILRSPYGRYKYGRSTVREGIMLKLKRFEDSEAMVVGFEELMHNANPAQKDERGYTKHTSHQIGQIPMNTLGALEVSWRDCIFRIGTGFSHLEREDIWKNRDQYLNKVVKFKYLETGMKDAPRHPVFLGWRSDLDV